MYYVATLTLEFLMLSEGTVQIGERNAGYRRQGVCDLWASLFEGGYRGYIGIMENTMETTSQGCGRVVANTGKT